MANPERGPESPSSQYAVLGDPARMAALRATGLADGEHADAFSRLARTAGRLLGVPMTLVSLIGDERDWFAGCFGPADWAADHGATGTSAPLCQLVASSGRPLVVNDTVAFASGADALTASTHNTSLPVERSYLGVPLTLASGHTVGAFCAMDIVPRVWTADEADALRDLALAATAQIELRIARSAQRESEQRTRLLFQSAPMPMWIFDLESLRIVDVNESASAQYGYSRDEFLRLTIADLRPPEEMVAMHRALAQPWAGMSHIGHARHRTRDGTLIDVDLTAQESVVDGRPCRMVLAQDVTQRNLAIEALRVSEERFALAARATGHAVWDWDLATDALSWGSGAHAVLGYPPEEQIDSMAWWKEQVHADDLQRVLDGMHRIVQGREHEWQEAYRFRRGDGGYASVIDRGTVVRDADRNAVRMIGAMEDVTAQHVLEEQLRQAQKMEAVGQLAGGIAHDFNNLLTVISGNLEFVRGDLPAEHAVRADLDEIAQAADRARGLVRRLLSFSRKQPFRLQDVRVRDVVKGSEQLLRRVIGEEILLAVDVLASTAHVRVDPGQLEQILMNLAVNARDAMLTPMHGRVGGGGTLSIQVEDMVLDAGDVRHWDGIAPGRWVRLAVRDNGHGMDAETRAHAFDPFFTTKAIGSGTGLGLATVFGIVRQAGGAIRVDSTVGSGTAFTILLPAIDVPAEQGAAALSVPARPLRRASTLLFVEDEAPVRLTTRRMLERHGYHVLAARHGADALLLWKEHHAVIDAVVTDLRMPEMSGPELVAHLRALRPTLPVVFVSGYADQDSQFGQKSHECFVAKPFSMDELLTAIEQVWAATPD